MSSIRFIDPVTQVEIVAPARYPMPELVSREARRRSGLLPQLRFFFDHAHPDSLWSDDPEVLTPTAQEVGLEPELMHRIHAWSRIAAEAELGVPAGAEWVQQGAILRAAIRDQLWLTHEVLEE